MEERNTHLARSDPLAFLPVGGLHDVTRRAGEFGARFRVDRLGTTVRLACYEREDGENRETRRKTDEAEALTSMVAAAVRSSSTGKPWKTSCGSARVEGRH